MFGLLGPTYVLPWSFNFNGILEPLFTLHLSFWILHIKHLKFYSSSHWILDFLWICVSNLSTGFPMAIWKPLHLSKKFHTLWINQDTWSKAALLTSDREYNTGLTCKLSLSFVIVGLEMFDASSLETLSQAIQLWMSHRCDGKLLSAIGNALLILKCVTENCEWKWQSPILKLWWKKSWKGGWKLD